MISNHQTTNWKLWNIWDDRIEKCKKEKVHSLDENFRNCCARSDNKSNHIVETRRGRDFRRCNIFNCPLGSL